MYESLPNSKNFTAIKIKKYAIALFYLSVVVILIAAFTMNTAKDRDQYLRFFSNPNMETRFEIGFVYYAKMVSMIVSPEYAVIFTILLIYILLGTSWFHLVSRPWLESFLIFNGLVFSIFQYFLGTAIRNGLAMAIAVYAAVKMLNGRRNYLLLLLVAPLIHYGVTLFVVIFLGVLLTTRLNWSIIRVGIILSIPAVFLMFKPLYEHFISVLGLPQSYYLEYIYQGFGKTERFRSYAMIIFAFSIIALLKTTDCQIRRISLYSIPFLAYYFITDITLFHRMLMPMLFFALVLCVNRYAERIKTFLTPKVWLFLLLIFNSVAFLYALNQYGLL